MNKTFHLVGFCGLVTIFFLSLSIAGAEDKTQENVGESNEGTLAGAGEDDHNNEEEKYDDEEDDDDENVSDPRPCPRNQLFGRAACDRICNYIDKKEVTSSESSRRASYDNIWLRPTTCRESKKFDETFCSCPNDQDGGLDLTICQKAGEEDVETELTSEEVSHCNSLCSLEDKTSYSCQVRVEWESVPVCACGGRVNLQFLETRERKKKWATMIREKRAGKTSGDSSTPPTRKDLENYLGSCVDVSKGLDQALQDVSKYLKELTKNLEKYSSKLKRTQ